MSLFDLIASNVSGKNNQKFNENCSSRANGGGETLKQVIWQCRYCGSRTGTYRDAIPKAGICVTRGKTTTGHLKPHEWRKVR